ncbi:MAG: ABC transporter ATP-binding protein/permease, partial [Acidimicrobiia bacterium]|nr:ABC transporter ATP-binding protein/permease [Acidimicrobiia bacterium]
FDEAVPVWRLAWMISQERRREFWGSYIAFVLFFAFPALTGYILGEAFNALTDGSTRRLYWMAAALAVAETARLAILHYGAVTFTRCWYLMKSLMQGNMLIGQVSSGGVDAGQPVGSAGQSVTRFRDDTEDVALFIDGWLDVSGALVFAVIALWIMAAIDATATAVVLIPMVAVAVVTKMLDTRIKYYRRADREATAAVTGLVGDVMAGATTVKVNAAVEPVLARLRGLVDVRRHTATRDRVFDDALQSVTSGSGDVAMGLVLIVAAGAIASGRFDLGELVLFTVYLSWLGFFPRMIGRTIARFNQATVAFNGMRHLVARKDPEWVARHRNLPVAKAGEVERALPVRVPLDELRVERLSAVYADGEAGIHDFSFTVPRGSFTVVTGPVGAGKSTLLRALLGLAWQAEHESGRVLWNGVEIEDRAAFLVPPQAAFLSQVPQLLSDSLADNILLGADVGANGSTDGAADRAADELDPLWWALAVASVDTDVADMAHGVDTLIGPRGLRLSGGQRQRVAAARALVQRPELLVLDDLSSAVDVETELRLWSNLAAAGITVIAVSHRKVAFDRADQLLALDNGRLV